MTDQPQPTSWRDVYALVRDTHSDVMTALNVVDDKVTKVSARVEVIERDRRDESVTRDAQAAVAATQRRNIITAINVSRGTIALFVSLGALTLAFIRG